MAMKPRTLKFAISTLVSGLLLVAIAAVATAHYLGSRRVLYLTTNEMMGQIAQAMNDKLAQRLHTVEKLNTLIADLIRCGYVDLGQEDQLGEFLEAILQANPALAQIDLGLPAGHRYQARRMADGSISRHRTHRAAQTVISTWQHRNPAYAQEFPDKVENLAAGYDPRTRPWWQAGLQSGKRVWTGITPTRRGLSYGNVNPVLDGNGKLLAMVAIDVDLADLSLFLNRFKLGKGGQAFIFDSDFHVVAMSMAEPGGLERFIKPLPAGETGFALRDLAELGDDDVRVAVQAYRQTPEMAGRGFLACSDPGRQRLLAAFEPDPRYRFTFGVVMPENSLLGPIKHSLNQTMAIAGLFLVLSLAVAYAISRAIARPLTILAREVDRIRTLDLEDGPSIRTSILEVVRIDQSIQDMKKGLRSFRRYVPADLVVKLMRLQKEAVIEGERRTLTMLFSDIQDFTRISEQLPPEQLLAMLETYFGEATRILVEHAGTVDKYIGDAIMAFWGAPTPVPDHAERACRAALAAQDRIQTLNQVWRSQGRPVFRTRIGIHTGEATVGNVGYAERMNYTVIGDSVNLASRLEGLNKYYDTSILVSEATLAAAGGAVLARPVDRVAVKGRNQAITIFEPLAMRAEASPELIETARRGQEAFGLYQQRRWAEALALLAEVDGPMAVLAERCRTCQAAPPGPDWDGVFRHQDK
jgi:adenylate cyclase